MKTTLNTIDIQKLKAKNDIFGKRKRRNSIYVILQAIQSHVFQIINNNNSYFKYVDIDLTI